jgi:hypothetical protein
VPLSGSLPLFVVGTTMYEVSMGALAILLATFTGSMAQYGLLNRRRHDERVHAHAGGDERCNPPPWAYSKARCQYRRFRHAFERVRAAVFRNKEAGDLTLHPRREQNRARTAGVPLFIEEVTRLLLEHGGQGGIQAIPPTLQQSLMARLDRLGPAREVAQYDDADAPLEPCATGRRPARDDRR